MSPAEKILDAFGEKLLTDTRESLRNEGVTFGGGQDSKLAAKSDFNIIQKGIGLEFQFLMPKEWYWVNYGREPGPISKEGSKEISSWATRKAIVGDFITKNLAARKKAQEEGKSGYLRNADRKYKTLKKLSFEKGLKALTFLIKRSVEKNGYEATHFFDKVLNDGRLKVLEAELTAALRRQIIVDIKIDIKK